MAISLIDTHAHYNSCVMDVNKEFFKLRINDNVSKVINVGLDVKTSLEALKLSLKYSYMYATLGVHPLYNGCIKDLELLYYKYNHDKVVAIGETGIDTSGNVNEQIDKFLDSIKLANKFKLPLIIHSNTINNSCDSAHKICLEIIKRYPPKYGFIFHCFQPDLDVLDSIIDLGGYISVGSKITGKYAKKSLQIVSEVPIDKLLIETDYPFLTHNPKETGYNTFNKICEIKRKDKVYMMNKLNGNAYRLFPKLYN